MKRIIAIITIFVFLSHPLVIFGFDIAGNPELPEGDYSFDCDEEVQAASNDMQPTPGYSDIRRSAQVGIRGDMPGDEWTMFKGNLTHGGVSPSKGPVTKQIRWQNASGPGNVYSSPTVGGGKVYFGKTNGVVYAFDAQTGAPEWNTGTTIPGGAYGVSCTPAYANDHIVIMNNQYNTVYRLDATSGAVNWSRDYTDGVYGGSSAAIYNGKVVVGLSDSPGTVNGKLVVIDEITGKETWNYTIDAGSYGILSSPAIWDEKIYVGGCDNYIYCFNLTQSGTPEYLWRYNAADDIYCSPMIANDTLFFGRGAYPGASGTYRFYAMDPDPDDNGDGTIDNLDTDEGLRELVGSQYDLKWIFNISWSGLVTPVWYKNTVYVGIENGSLYAIKEDPDGSGYIETDEILWEFDVGNIMWASPVISRATDKLYIGSQSQVFYCLNATTGEVIWKESLGGAIDATAALANDLVYIPDFTGNIYCFEKSSDMMLPTMSEYSPESGETEVSVNANVSVIFSEDIEMDTMNSDTIKVHNETGAPVSGTRSYKTLERNMTFMPDAPFEYEMEYTVTVTSSVRDLVGNPFDGDSDGIAENSPADDFVWTFKTDKLHLPELSEIPQQNPTEDEEYLLDLAPYITDNDTNIADQTIGEDSGYVNVIGHSLRFLYPNGVLNDTVNLTVSDGNALVYTHIDVVVTPVNDAPVITHIPDQYAEEELNYVLDVWSYVSDIDNTHEELNVTTNSSYASVDGLAITFNYPEFMSYELVNVTVTDGEYSDSTDVNIYIGAINDPPTLTEALVTPKLGTYTTSFTYYITYSDIENTGPSSIRVIIDGNPLKMTPVDTDDNDYTDGRRYQYTRTLFGGAHVYKFTCSDGTDTFETNLFNGPTVFKPESGAFNGTVLDKLTGEPITSAKVMITNMTKISVNYYTGTYSDGTYFKSELNPGRYLLYANASGYKTAPKVTRDLEASQVVEVNFILEKLEGPAVDDTDVTEAKIEVDKTEPKVNESVKLTGSAEDADGDELTYIWDFGDESSDDGQQVSHTYAEAGEYEITLTVLDSDATAAVTTFEITIAPTDIVPTNNTPVKNVRIEADKTTVYVGEVVTFQGLAEDLDGDVLRFTWNFGDDTGVMIDDVAEHSYTRPGTYTVTLNVTDDDNTFGTATVEIEVLQKKSGTSKSAGGLDPAILLIITIIILIVVIIAFMFMRNKKKKEEQAKKEAEKPLIPDYVPTPQLPIVDIPELQQPPPDFQEPAVPKAELVSPAAPEAADIPTTTEEYIHEPLASGAPESEGEGADTSIFTLPGESADELTGEAPEAPSEPQPIFGESLLESLETEGAPVEAAEPEAEPAESQEAGESKKEAGPQVVDAEFTEVEDTEKPTDKKKPGTKEDDLWDV